MELKTKQLIERVALTFGNYTLEESVSYDPIEDNFLFNYRIYKKEKVVGGILSLNERLTKVKMLDLLIRTEETEVKKQQFYSSL